MVTKSHHVKERSRTLMSGADVHSRWSGILLIEDNSARSQRRAPLGVRSRSSLVTVTLHRIRGAKNIVIAEASYLAGELAGGIRCGGKAAIAFKLLDRLRLRRAGTLVVAGPGYGCNRWFLNGLVARGYDFVVEVRPTTQVSCLTSHNGRVTPASRLLGRASWKRFQVDVPCAKASVAYAAADLAEVPLPGGHIGRLFAAETGGILGVHRGTTFGVTSARRANLKQLLEAVGWARWIRHVVRRTERLVREGEGKAGSVQTGNGHRKNRINLTVRANIALAQRQDQTAVWNQAELSLNCRSSRGIFAPLSQVNVVELFAGAGGMGLGFLLAARSVGRYRLVFSAEVNPTYVATLKRNHEMLRSFQRGPRRGVPEEVLPVDLRAPASLALIRAYAREAGGVHVLIGGPPCQGFSNANRNSWHRDNPNNRLVEAFIRCVEAVRPPVFVMENVQGVLWTPRNGGSSVQLSVVEHLARRFSSAGYLLFPKLLDAVWYGVPQYRSRFFLLGLRRDLGYGTDDFGSWGPFPRPTHGPGTGRQYVTVRDAIGDLPQIGNGGQVETVPYEEPNAEAMKTNAFLRSMRKRAPKGLILDHVTSRHADYVIERYRRIPAGGNWQDIAGLLTNYTEVERTHSNIYRRLTWEQPSVTIGHYRKSMLVHPGQHRGLSLREASRLQSFPDWFRFSGNANGGQGGLVHKQQQLANAVCPLVTRALAEFILRL